MSTLDVEVVPGSVVPAAGVVVAGRVSAVGEGMRQLGRMRCHGIRRVVWGSSLCLSTSRIIRKKPGEEGEGRVGRCC